MVIRSLLAVGTVISLVSPTSAHAQLSVEIAPMLGAYVPGSRLPDPRIETCITKGGGSCGLTGWYNQGSAVALGGRITAGSLHELVAVDATLWYVPTQVGGQSGNVVMSSLGLALRLAPKAPVSGLLTAGPAVIHRFGDFYSGAMGTTSLGGTFGLGLAAHPGRHFGLRAEIAAYLYQLQFHNQLTPDQLVIQQQGHLYASSGMFQNDFVFSLSISPFGQRSEAKQ